MKVLIEDQIFLLLLRWRSTLDITLFCTHTRLLKVRLQLESLSPAKMIE